MMVFDPCDHYAVFLAIDIQKANLNTLFLGVWDLDRDVMDCFSGLILNENEANRFSGDNVQCF